MKATPQQPQTANTSLVKVSLGKLLDTEFVKRKPLLSPWLRQGESALVYAEAGVGKSMFVMSMALAIAGGGKFLDWECTEPRKVLFWDGEMFQDDIKERANALMPTIEGLDEDVANDNLDFYPRQGQEPGSWFPELNNKEGRNAFAKEAKGYDLVVLDNLSTLASIPDENAASAFNDPVKLLATFKQMGVACILVHHTNKSGKKARGSSKIDTTFEVKMLLEKWPHPKEQGNTAFKLKWEKYRHKRDEAIQDSCMWLEDTDSGHLEWMTGGDPDAEMDKLVRFMKSTEYTTQMELAKALDWSTGKTSGVMADARAAHKYTNEDWAEWKQIAKEKKAGQSDSPRLSLVTAGDLDDFDADF